MTATIHTWLASGRALVVMLAAALGLVVWLSTMHDMAVSNASTLRVHDAELQSNKDRITTLDKSVAILQHDTQEMAENIKDLKSQSLQQIRILERLAAALKVPAEGRQ